MNHAPISRVSIPAFISDLDLVLLRLQQMGLNWKRTRFGHYRRLLDEIAALPHPRRVSYGDPAERERDRLYREAINQCEQLRVSTRFWEHQDPAVLVSKLTNILKGSPLPAAGTESDKPRNDLLELATGSLLSLHGFKVTLTKDREDLVAVSPVLPEELAVEVKRPTSERSIERNLKEVRRQLRGRCQKPNRRGMAVIASDRLLNLSGSLATANSEAEFRALLDSELARRTRQLHALAQRKDLKLFPTTPFLAAILVGTVVLQDWGLPTFLGVLAIHSTARTDDLDQDRIDRMRYQLAADSV